MDTELDKRINRLVGQIQGIRKMIHAKRETDAIAQQIVAAREALSKLALIVLKEDMKDSPEAKKIEKLMKTVFGI